MARLRRSIQETRTKDSDPQRALEYFPIQPLADAVPHNSRLAQGSLIQNGGQSLIALRQPRQRCRVISRRCLGFNPNLCSLRAKLGGGALSERQAELHRFRSIARKNKFQRLGESLKPLRQPV